MANRDAVANIARASGQPGFAATTGADMVSLADILATVRRRLRLVAIVAAVFTLAGLAYAVFSKPIYDAKVLTQPADDEQSGSFGSLTNRFGNAASLIGIDMSNADAGRKKNLAILRSRELALRFIKSNNLLPLLFPERWDTEKQQWKPLSDSILARSLRAVKDALVWLSEDEGQRERSTVPSDWEALKLFETVRRVEENIISGVITVGFEFRNPYLAAQWANDYIALANEEIRTQTVAEADLALKYLTAKGNETTFAGLRESIYNLVEQQLQVITLANSRPDYAFRVIDPATPPEEPISPKRALIVVMAVFAGIFAGAFLAVTDEFLRPGANARRAMQTDGEVRP